MVGLCPMLCPKLQCWAALRVWVVPCALEPAAPVVVEGTTVLPGHCWCWCCPSPVIDFSPCTGLPSWCLVLYLCVDSPVSAAVLPLGLIITVACNTANDVLSLII
jgi:hypothetical protein